MNLSAMHRERLAARRRALAVLVERRLARQPEADVSDRPRTPPDASNYRLHGDVLVLLDE